MSASLRLQLNQFFQLCPEGDYLTAEDVAAKYLVDLSFAYKVLKAMAAEGLVEPMHVPSPKMNRKVVAFRAVQVTA
jgi:ribosomal protein S25